MAGIAVHPVFLDDGADGHWFDVHSGLSPEIAYFWDTEKDAQDKDRDWYIKGNGYVAVLMCIPFHQHFQCQAQWGCFL